MLNLQQDLHFAHHGPSKQLPPPDISSTFRLSSSLISCASLILWRTLGNGCRGVAHGGWCDPYLQRRAARQETFDFYMVIEAKSKDSVDIRKLSCLRSMRTYNILMIYIYNHQNNPGTSHQANTKHNSNNLNPGNSRDFLLTAFFTRQPIVITAHPDTLSDDLPFWGISRQCLLGTETGRGVRTGGTYHGT